MFGIDRFFSRGEIEVISSEVENPIQTNMKYLLITYLLVGNGLKLEANSVYSNHHHGSFLIRSS